MVEANKAPKVVLLENVPGLLHKNRSGIAPIDVVMDGVVLEGGRATPVGLRANFSDDYVRHPGSDDTLIASPRLAHGPGEDLLGHGPQRPLQ